MPTLHVYLDESGDLNFKATGTRYYVFAAAWTYDPHPIALDLSNLRFSLLKQGFDIQSFHATEDRQINRNAVLGILERHEGWQHGAIIVEKAKVDPSLYEPQRFYPEFAGMLLRAAPPSAPARSMMRHAPQGHRKGHSEGDAHGQEGVTTRAVYAF